MCNSIVLSQSLESIMNTVLCIDKKRISDLKDVCYLDRHDTDRSKRQA